MTVDQVQNGVQRAAVYVDGFNMYHALVDMGEPFLKWYCVKKLSENMVLKGGFRLVRVVFCSAFPSGESSETQDRFTAYTNVLKARGVDVILGHYLEERTSGKWSEKQSDVNLSLACILDGVDDIYDVAYLITADSDQAATARVFRERFPGKKLIPVSPPFRVVPTKTQSYSTKGFVISKADIEECVMEAFEPGKVGIIRRPSVYAPPEWWMHPNHRPNRNR